MAESKLPLVPMSSPDLTDAEREAVSAVMNTPNLSMGSQVLAFEDSFREYSGRKHAIAVNSGTAGLHLCVRASGIRRGDLVITTPFSFVATVNVLLYEGAIPVLVDVDPETGNMDPALVAQAVADLSHGGDQAKKWLPRRGAEACGSLKAIETVDVFGQPADYDPIAKVAADHELEIIEDSCESLGAEYKGRKAGTLGDSAVFAFYPNKQITVGEGGMILTDDDDKANLMRSLRNQGRAVGDTWLQHTYLGYNYRLDELSSALGVAQMKRLPELLQKRQRVADWYNMRLAGIDGVKPYAISPHTTKPSWFVYVVKTDPEVQRDELAAKLSARGVPVRPYFLPIHLQPYMVEQFGYQPGDFPVTEDLGRRGLALPFSGVMTEEQVELVCRMLSECL